MTVTLGVDPHKASHTVVATDQVGRQLTQTTTRGTRTSDHKELIGGRRAAPLECSSGAWQRHRLSRVGNRQLNAALHRIAVTELRVDPPAQAYLTRLQAAGKSKREALRVLKRRLVRVVFNLLQADLPQARLAPSAAPLAGARTSRVTSERCAVGPTATSWCWPSSVGSGSVVAAGHEVHLILTI